MAVTPALTYPSKTFKSHAATNNTNFKQALLYISKSFLGTPIPMWSQAATPRVLTPKQFFRPTATTSTFLTNDRIFTLTAMSKRVVQKGITGRVTVRTFPIPYLQRDTAFTYGLFWPRPVKPQ